MKENTLHEAEKLIQDILTDLIEDLPMEEINIFISYSKKNEEPARIEKVNHVTIYGKTL